MKNKDFSKTPEAACRLVAAVQFVDNGEESKTVKVRLLARSAEPIYHWWWGKVVHDFSGMRKKPRIPIDYAHNDREIMGYLNNFEVDREGLHVAGALTPWRDDDRASEVIYKQREGVPYEASIDFAGDGIRYEYIEEGQYTEVNGNQFDGPGIVIREWPLRGVAICPYGADENTETAILKGGKTIAAFAADGGNQMATDAEITKDVENIEEEENTTVETEADVEVKVTVKAEVETEEAVEEEVVEEEVVEEETEIETDETEEIKGIDAERAEFRRMVKDFGADVAAHVFSKGGTYLDALKLSHDALRKTVAKLATKLGGKPAKFVSYDKGTTGDPWKNAQKKG